MEAPPGFRYIDIHTHLHLERLGRAIRRWFAERSTWKLEYPSEPEEVAAFLAGHGVERFVYFSYAHKAGHRPGHQCLAARRAAARTCRRPLGTVHPDDPDMMDVAEQALVCYGFPGFKFHINVQRFFPTTRGCSRSMSGSSPPIASCSFTSARRPGPTSTMAFLASSG